MTLLTSRRITVALAALLISFAASVPAAIARGGAPDAAIVAKTLDGFTSSGGSGPKAVVKVNSVRFGAAYRATAQEVQVEGIPLGATVTPAIVDFTVRTYYSDATQAIRRVREMYFYKDKFGEWAGKIGSARGQDVSTSEPAVRK